MSSGRVYTANFTSVAVTAQQDLISILASATSSFEIIEIWLSQSTEVGDAQEEGLSILLKTGATTVGSGGTTMTPPPRQLTDTAFGGTVRINDTTPASAGTIVTHEALNWNVRAPFQRLWVPDCTIVCRVSTRFVLGLATTPADSITMSANILFRELA